jgi:uracil-DNA glycosylase family 4
MTLDRRLLQTYLQQRVELGEHELFLDELSAAEALRILRSPSADRRPSSAPGEAGSPASRRVSGEGASARGAQVAAGPRSSIVDHRPGGGEEGRRSAVVGRRPGVEGGGRGKKELAVLGEQAAGCTRCRLHEGRRSVVFGVGNPAAEVVVVGEAPGAEEDRTGLPFVGQAGKLLDLMLMSIGLRRDDVYICNVLKCRPPKNRNPMADEVATCSEYLHGQLEIIAPRVLLAVGKFAAQTLTGSDKSIGRLRGAVHSYQGIPLIASYHPAYLLRSPNMTATAWQDLQLLRQVLDGQL